MKPRIAVVGRGNVGTALQSGLSRAGYEVRTAGKQREQVRGNAAWGDIVVLAVPFNAVDSALDEIGDAVDGKPLVDVTNVLTPDYQLAIGCTSSGAEELQKKAPRAKVVKAFNTVFAKNQSTGKVKGQAITLFAAGDDASAKGLVLALGRDIGFDAVDAGPLTNARWLETLGYFHIQLGYTLHMGSDIGIRLVH